jgi:glycosyltransferase involved in cell wall biosynthesis
MDNPKISIVTVVFNGVKYIENTILSVINQTYENIEYIVVDGGSVDGTIDIVNKYKSHISRFISEPDNGIYDAMNKGIRNATGEWILFRNCGDYFSSVEDVNLVFDTKNCYDGYDIISGDAIVWDKWGYKRKQPEFVCENRIGVMPVWHPSTFIRTTLHKKRLFNLKYKLAADHDFFVDVIGHGAKCKYVPLSLSIFDIGEGASCQGQIKGRKEHYYIYGGSDSDRLSIWKLNIQLMILKLKLDFRKLIPDNIMKKRREFQCWTLWNENMTSNLMIERAIGKYNRLSQSVDKCTSN